MIKLGLLARLLCPEGIIGHQQAINFSRYEDDEDRGNEIIYTGAGGFDKAY
jgi:hypothetical protein